MLATSCKPCHEGPCARIARTGTHDDDSANVSALPAAFAAGYTDARAVRGDERGT